MAGRVVGAVVEPEGRTRVPVGVFTITGEVPLSRHWGRLSMGKHSTLVENWVARATAL